MPLNEKNSDADMLDDAALIKAARKRILRELEMQNAGGMSSTINNNNYGGGAGLMERMNGAQTEDPALRDYFVDVTREDLPEVNPATGKPRGWKKSVHRHTSPRGK